MSGHSAGPWRHSFKSSKTNNLAVYGSSGFLVASVDVHQLCPKDTMKRRTADARLIAAAPCLLAALIACEHELHAVLRSINTDSVHFDGDEFHERLASARAAIAKAEGEQS